ncbi:hypothetical protein R5R35_012902 [Gryllus longicercus]|uniref:Cytochrome c oxidase assembly factor 5 n=1 Tax=Gryllus longicercus TaxID=2509291 RepID=A0AAN9W7N8_9ORTH
MKFDVDSVGLEDQSACAGVRADLKMCLLESDCVKVHKKTPRQCFQEQDSSVPNECYVLRNLFFECKRSLLDNRQRFRGRKGY